MITWFRVPRKIGSYGLRGRRPKTPGRGKLAIIKQGSIKSDGLQDLGQNIHAGSKLRRSSLGKLARTLGQVNHIILASQQENQTLR